MGSDYLYVGLNVVGSTVPASYKPVAHHAVLVYNYTKKPEAPKKSGSERNSNAVIEDSDDYYPIQCWFDKPRICRIGACSEMEDLSYYSLVENYSVVPEKQMFDEFSSCSVSCWK